MDPKTGRVLAPRGEVAYTESGGLKEQISVLVTTRADGRVMKSCIVYPYKRVVPRPIIDAMPAGFSVARSDSGWMTSEVFYEYIANTFIPELDCERRYEKGLNEGEELKLDDSDWVVLWIDGYSSHLTLHTSKLCEMHKTELYCFKAYASHICQPNDVGPFKPMKNEWKSALTAWRIEHPYEQLTRVAFASLLSKAIENLDKTSIIAGYRATGLFPFNVEAVHFDKLTHSLTATNRQKFDERAFGSPVLSASDYSTALRCVESVLGKSEVQKYVEAYENERSNPARPNVMNGFPSAYDVWVSIKKRCHEGETRRNICVTAQQVNTNQSSSTSICQSAVCTIPLADNATGTMSMPATVHSGENVRRDAALQVIGNVADQVNGASWPQNCSAITSISDTTNNANLLSLHSVAPIPSNDSSQWMLSDPNPNQCTPLSGGESKGTSMPGNEETSPWLQSYMVCKFCIWHC